MTDTLLLLREHVADQHPLLDCEGCPVCGKTAQRLRRNALTDLNRATSALYSACMSNGGHVPSGERIVRPFPIGERSLPICRNCRVPYGKAVGYWGDPSSGAKGGRA